MRNFTLLITLCCLCYGVKAEDITATAELLSTDYVFTEGPVWCEDGQYLLFSDIRGDAIHKWSEKGGAEMFVSPSQFTNGNTYDGNSFYICRYTTRDIAKLSKDGKMSSLVSNYEGKKFSSPNDLIVSQSGNIYFVDPDFGLKDKTQKEIPFPGLFQIASNGSVATLVDSTLVKPNGVVISPEQDILYLCETEGNILYKYTIAPDGTTSNREVFCKIPGAGSLDGLACYKENGYLFVALGKGGMVVVSPEGEIVDRVTFTHGESTRNMCFGGEDGKTLFITAGTSLYRYNYDLSRLK